MEKRNSRGQTEEEFLFTDINSHNSLTDCSFNWRRSMKSCSVSFFFEQKGKCSHDCRVRNMNFGFGEVFGGLFGPVPKGDCRLGLNGLIAVNVNTGDTPRCKTYDVKLYYG